MFNFKFFTPESSIALKWAGIIFLIGSLYIYVSDLVLDQLITDYSFYSTYQTYKGILLFSITSFVFFLIIRHLLSQINREKESLQFALEAGNMATWDYDVRTDEVTPSKNHHELYGYANAPEDWTHSRFLSHLPEEEQKRVEEELIHSVQKNGKIDKEVKIKTQNGKTCWRWIRGRVKYDNNGQPKRISGVLIDIDHRKKAEQKLRQEEKFIEVSMNSVPGIFFVLDKNGCLIRWNYNANKVSGLSDEELKGLHIIKRVEEKDKEKAKKALNTVLTEGEVQTELTLKTTDKDRSVYEITASRFENDGDLFIVGTGIDITELMLYQEKIRRQNYQLQTAQNISKIGYWENNLDRNELNWTDSVYELFGLDKKKFNLTMDNFQTLIHQKDREKLEKDIEGLKKAGTFETKYRVEKPDGSMGWFQEIGEVFKWENGKPKVLHGIVMDITQQIETEKEIRKSLLEGENKERKRIANELHDGIAQYLSAALMHFDGAESSLYAIKEKHTEKLLNARKLVKDALTETQAISQNLMPKNIEQYGLIATVKSLIKQYDIATDIQFNFNCENVELDEELSSEVEINLYRIIQELLSNAVRHSKCDTIWIHLRIDNQMLSCILKDNGIGQNLSKIETAKGLGLQSIYNRIQLLSGSVQFLNQPEKGLEVRINIPVKQS